MLSRAGAGKCSPKFSVPVTQNFRSVQELKLCTAEQVIASAVKIYVLGIGNGKRSQSLALLSRLLLC